MYLERAERGSLYRVIMLIKIESITQFGSKLFLLIKVTQTFEVYHESAWEM